LHNARRGLAKPSSHGRYLAMDLEPIERGAPITADAEANGSGIGVLGLVFERQWAERLARREEYDASKFLELLDLADRAGVPLGNFLLEIAERTNFDMLEYRSALRGLLGYTSHGYIFHPVPFRDGRVAIAAIGSGYEGSGDPAVCSKRREFGMDRLLALHEALRVASFDLDHDGPLGYFVECILGGLHGLGVHDLVGGFGPDTETLSMLAERMTPALPLERSLFMSATSLDEKRYRRTFGGIASGLEHIFEGIAR
jgi:hypothetical protein